MPVFVYHPNVFWFLVHNAILCVDPVYVITILLIYPWIRKSLHLAARQGNLDTVELLVSEGADIKDNKGVSI